jgi:DNA-binding CsgD family transcriptional regulator
MFSAAGTETMGQHRPIASCWNGATLGPVDASSGRDPIIQEVHRFAQRTLRCSAAIFYWVKDDQATHDAGVTGLPPSLWSEYLAEMAVFDPLSVRALLSTGANLARLPAGAGLAGPPRVYLHFLARYRVQDVIDMLFYAGGEPVAGLGLIKLEGDAPLSPETLDLADAMRPLIETSLQHHQRVRTSLRRKRLTTEYLLTLREVEVAELVSDGHSNDVVAECLDVRLPTIKSHLLSIFGKTGATSRTDLARLMRV